MEGVQFSVIIPALNEEKFLPNLLTSLLRQSYKEFEVIIVDGSSKDETVTVAKGFAHKLPTLSVIQTKIASLPLQRNAGARKAKGRWLVFVDADTVLRPTFFAEVTRHVSSHDCQAVTTWCVPDGHLWWEQWVAFYANLTLEVSVLAHRQLTPGPLTVVGKDLFASAGGYNEDLHFAEDFDFGQRLARQGAHLHIIRKRLYVWSLRRMRAVGVWSTLRIYLKAAARALITKRTYPQVAGYEMGGQLYR